MHYTKAKGILSSNNGMNLYRGCQHGCIYCDSRSACYQFQHDFEDIEVKENALELLEKALKNKRKKCMIGTGSMSDPYMPLETRLEYTRKALQLIDRYGFGVALLTKSDLVLRDLDLLKNINHNSKAVVQMTLTTWDDKLCRILEPGVCNTQKRIEVLHRFHEEGIPTVVWLCPLLPFINDTQENLEHILSACANAGVMGIMNFGMGMTLREGSREYFYKMLDTHFPGLKQKYISTFGNAYEIASPNWRSLDEFFRDYCKKKKILHDRDEIFTYLNTYPHEKEAMQLCFW